MLFNSCAFLFLYLPPVLCGYYLLARWRPQACPAWLALASLGFYGWWKPAHLPLLLLSIVLNFGAAHAIAMARGARRRHWLVAAITANLLALAWFKYADFALTSCGLMPLEIELPVGISFFTFTQIAYLVDCHRRQARRSGLTRYALFVSYFPHLIAGPILHHRSMMPQFADPAARRIDPDALALGTTLFVMGLAKKVLLADPLAALVGPVFTAGARPPLVEAWVAVFAYAFQLYFDFSGYTDMALGLSRLFRITLPENFDGPYRARDIADFWRRWHMTLSAFLRNYLYIPLGGNRQGGLRRVRNLMLTMLLGGLWHGAGWNFVVWGALHGGYLGLHALWRARAPWRLPAPVAWPVTFLAVCLAWVPFRAPDLGTAGAVLRALAGANGCDLPHALARPLSWLPAVQFTGLRWIQGNGAALPTLALAAVLAFTAPTTARLVATRWQATPAWGAACAVLFVVCVFGLNRPTQFLYFQF